jgi:predicted Zn finger-like uncharacterized protein
MAVLLECPKCSSTLRIGEAVLGKKVKCPKCHTIFPAKEPEPDVLVEEEIIEEEPLDDEDPDVLDESSAKGYKRDGIVKGEAPRPRRGNHYAKGDENDEARPRKKRQRYDEDDEEDDRFATNRRRDEEEEDEDDRPRKKRKKEGQQGWLEVSAGLSTILMSIYGMIILSFTPILFIPILFLFRSFVLVLVLYGLLILGSFALQGLNVYGHYLNLNPPVRRDISLKGMSLATFVCVATSVGMLVLTFLIILISFFSIGAAGMGGAMASLDMMGAAGTIGYLCYVIAGLAGLAGQILFLLFLRGICLAFGKRDKAWGVVVFIIASVSMSFGVFFLSFIFILALQNLVAVIIAWILILGVWLAILIWYILLISGVREVIDSGMRRRY